MEGEWRGREILDSDEELTLAGEVVFQTMSKLERCMHSFPGKKAISTLFE
jgi:hypothetical protein